MSKSIIIKENGGPEVLELQNIEVGSPGPDEIKVTNHAIGLNYIDTYHRSGLYPLPLPAEWLVSLATARRSSPFCRLLSLCWSKTTTPSSPSLAVPECSAFVPALASKAARVSARATRPR